MLCRRFSGVLRFALCYCAALAVSLFACVAPFLLNLHAFAVNWLATIFAWVVFDFECLFAARQRLFWRFRLALYYALHCCMHCFCVLKVNFAISRLIVLFLLCEFQRWVSARKQFEDAGVFDRGIGLPRGLGIALPLH